MVEQFLFLESGDELNQAVFCMVAKARMQVYNLYSKYPRIPHTVSTQLALSSDLLKLLYFSGKGATAANWVQGTNEFTWRGSWLFCSAARTRTLRQADTPLSTNPLQRYR